MARAQLVLRVCVLMIQLMSAISSDEDLQRFCQFDVSVAAHGAVGNGLADDTNAIQATIDAVAALVVQYRRGWSSRLDRDHYSTASNGNVRGCAVLRSGVFVSGTVFLRSHVTLYIGRTAVLKASLNHSAFVPDHDWPGQAALVAGYRADDSGVAGHGVIDGQAPMFVTSLDAMTDQFRFGSNGWVYPEIDRVRLVDFAHSRRVSVRDVSIIDSTGFHVHFLNCSDVLADSVTISADLRWPNNDGIDVTSCNDTIIRDCSITTGDDAISPKTWQGYGPLHNLLIERCRFRARSGGIHFGASSWYDYVNVTIRDTVVLDAHGGLNVQTRGPGSVRNLTVTNFMVSHAIFDAPCQPWMGNAQPVAISADRWCGGPAPCDENGGPPAGTITVRSFGSFSQLHVTVLSCCCFCRLHELINHDNYIDGRDQNVVLENITSQSENGIFISGRVGGVSNVSMRNIRLLLEQRPDNNGSFPPCPSHSYWPTSGPRKKWAKDPVWDPIAGIFIEYATNVSLEDVFVSFVGTARPQNRFGECLQVDANTSTGVVHRRGSCDRGQPSSGSPVATIGTLLGGVR